MSFVREKKSNDKLETYVNEGGHLIITAGSLKNMPDGIAGVRAGNKKDRVLRSGDLQRTVVKRACSLYLVRTDLSGICDNPAKNRTNCRPLSS